MGKAKRDVLEIRHQRRFTQRADYAAFAAVRVHNTQLARFGGRNAWVYLESEDGGVYRTIRGSGAMPGFPPDGIEMDYDTCVDLGICAARVPSLRGSENDPSFFPCSLRIRSARNWELLRAHWRHPNPAYRVPLQISIALGGISVGLGAIGVILGLISLV